MRKFPVQVGGSGPNPADVVAVEGDYFPSLIPNESQIVDWNALPAYEQVRAGTLPAHAL